MNYLYLVFVDILYILCLLRSWKYIPATVVLSLASSILCISCICYYCACRVFVILLWTRNPKLVVLFLAFVTHCYLCVSFSLLLCLYSLSFLYLCHSVLRMCIILTTTLLVFSVISCLYHLLLVMFIILTTTLSVFSVIPIHLSLSIAYVYHSHYYFVLYFHAHYNAWAWYMTIPAWIYKRTLECLNLRWRSLRKYI